MEWLNFGGVRASRSYFELSFTGLWRNSSRTASGGLEFRADLELRNWGFSGRNLWHGSETAYDWACSFL